MELNELGLSGVFDAEDLAAVRSQLSEFQRLLTLYDFALQTVLTKVSILRDEFRLLHDYNPIEHVTSRMKSPESLILKVRRKGIPLTEEGLRENILDIAGVRLTCSFATDVYRVRDMLVRQPDLTILEERDYIANPKPNGYKSLHLIVAVPVYLTDGVEQMTVEIQLRTIAMDLWASLEHKIYYKYDKDVPRHLTDALKLAADVAESLDVSMERIHEEVLAIPPHSGGD